MKIDNVVVINKSVDSVWEIVGNQFGNAHIWASLLRHSEGNGKNITEKVCDSRTCDIKGMGRIHEKILEFSPDNYTLSYEVSEGFPFFVKHGVNRWRLVPEGEQTLFFMNAEIEFKGLIGMMMKPMMKMQMSSIMKKTAEDLKFYAENGTPHPRKKK